MRDELTKPQLQHSLTNIMYRVALIEHFEDWFVAEGTVGEFDSLLETIAAF